MLIILFLTLFSLVHTQFILDESRKGNGLTLNEVRDLHGMIKELNTNSKYKNYSKDEKNVLQTIVIKIIETHLYYDMGKTIEKLPIPRAKEILRSLAAFLTYIREVSVRKQLYQKLNNQLARSFSAQKQFQIILVELLKNVDYVHEQPVGFF